MDNHHTLSERLEAANRAFLDLGVVICEAALPYVEKLAKAIAAFLEAASRYIDAAVKVYVEAEKAYQDLDRAPRSMLLRALDNRRSWRRRARRIVRRWRR